MLSKPAEAARRKYKNGVWNKKEKEKLQEQLREDAESERFPS